MSAVRRDPECGEAVPGVQHVSALRRRVILQTDGELKPMDGDIYRPRRVVRFPGVDEEWQRMYWRGMSRCRKGDKGATFLALEALFAYENSWQFPPHDLPFMPRERADWFRPVDEVPRDRLL